MNPFRNPLEHRLRAVWRLLLQIILLLIISGLSALAVVAISGVSFSGMGDAVAASPLLSITTSIVGLAAAVASIWLAGRFLDRRPFSGFGMHVRERGWWSDLGFGLFLGALLMTCIFLVELAAGWVSVTGSFQAVVKEPFALAILDPLVLFLCVGIQEELLSRGYQLTNMAEGLNYPSIGPRGAVLLALVISSAIFGVLHIFNPGATLVSTVNISLAGIFLGLGYVLTGRLAIPIGLHITWNFFQGSVFGFPVSGMDTIGATFVETRQGGPDALTGGAFGPEAGLIGIVAMVTGSFLIVAWVRLRSGKTTLQTSIAEPPTSKTEVL